MAIRVGWLTSQAVLGKPHDGARREWPPHPRPLSHGGRGEKEHSWSERGLAISVAAI